MNLPAHIITCSPPSMNLPAHGTTSPDPSFISQHDNENKQSTLPYTRYILKLVLGIPMLPRSWSNSMNLPVRSPTHVIHQLHTSPHAASLKCEHGTYELTSLISPHESNRIWTSPLISSRVHHQSWTYPLMTTSSISQTRTHTTNHAKHITMHPAITPSPSVA